MEGNPENSNTKPVSSNFQVDKTQIAFYLEAAAVEAAVTAHAMENARAWKGGLMMMMMMKWKRRRVCVDEGNRGQGA
jgi:hypothetical protein